MSNYMYLLYIFTLHAYSHFISHIPYNIHIKDIICKYIYLPEQIIINNTVLETSYHILLISYNGLSIVLGTRAK